MSDVVARCGPGPGEVALGEVLDFLRLIWAVDHALQRTSKRMAASLGVTGPQRLVLRIAGRFPGLTAGMLASLLHVHPSTLTGVLGRLERAHLLRRRDDPRDRRRTLIGLTERGRLVDRQPGPTIEAAVQRLLRKLPARDVDVARAALGALAAELEAGLREEEDRA